MTLPPSARTRTPRSGATRRDDAAPAPVPQPLPVAADQRASIVQRADPAAIARRPGEQTELARGRARGGEVDGLAQADAERRGDPRAVVLRALTAGATRGEHLDVLKRELGSPALARDEDVDPSTGHDSPRRGRGDRPPPPAPRADRRDRRSAARAAAARSRRRRSTATASLAPTTASASAGGAAGANRAGTRRTARSPRDTRCPASSGRRATSTSTSGASCSRSAASRRDTSDAASAPSTSASPSSSAARRRRLTATAAGGRD